MKTKPRDYTHINDAWMAQHGLVRAYVFDKIERARKVIYRTKEEIRKMQLRGIHVYIPAT